MNSTRFTIAALMFAMVNAVLFGVGLVTVLAIPTFAAHAMALIPAVVAASFIFAAPISWMLAPRLRARYWRQRAVRERLAFQNR
jgi:hypothetical protein